MIINTKNFGELTIGESDKIHFEEGLLGFEDKREFVLLNNYDTEDPVPFMWLQSVDDPELTFVVSIPFFLKPDYEFEIEDQDCKQMDIQKPDNVGVYSICKIQDSVENMTFNLKSPIIINATNRKAKQIILYNSSYKVDESYQR